jgi:hypothetical protein
MHTIPRALLLALAETPLLNKNNADSVLDLIYHEVFLRQQRQEQVSIDDFIQRFPLHADSLRRHSGSGGVDGSRRPEELDIALLPNEPANRSDHDVLDHEAGGGRKSGGPRLRRGRWHRRRCVARAATG